MSIKKNHCSGHCFSIKSRIRREYLGEINLHRTYTYRICRPLITRKHIYIFGYSNKLFCSISIQLQFTYIIAFIIKYQILRYPNAIFCTSSIKCYTHRYIYVHVYESIDLVYTKTLYQIVCTDKL